MMARPPAEWAERWVRGGFSFLSGLSRRELERKLLLPIQVNIDESGEIGQSPVFVMAGVMDEASKWLEFSEAWNEELAGYPILEYFKMHEAHSRAGQFARSRFSEELRNHRVDAFATIVGSYRPRLIRSTVHLGDFIQFRERQRAMGRPWRLTKSPYVWAFQQLITWIALALRDEGVTEPCELIFDTNDIFGPRVKALYPWMRMAIPEDDLRALLPTDFISRDDKKWKPLQAADLVAWMYRRDDSGDDNPFQWVWGRMGQCHEMGARLDRSILSPMMDQANTLLDAIERRQNDEED